MTRGIAIIPAAIVTIWWGAEGTAKLLILSQVVLSLQLPFAIVPLVMFTGRPAVMGELVSPAWLRGLGASEQGGPAAPITSIYSCHDNFVVPQDSSVLAGAKNVPLPGIGHLSLVFSERVAALLEAELRG